MPKGGSSSCKYKQIEYFTTKYSIYNIHCLKKEKPPQKNLGQSNIRERWNIQSSSYTRLKNISIALYWMLDCMVVHDPESIDALAVIL